MAKIQYLHKVKNFDSLEDSKYDFTFRDANEVKNSVNFLYDFVTNSQTGTTANVFIGEIPIGILNGVNNIFTSSQTFIVTSLQVFVNGLKIKLIDEYNTVGNNTINLTFSPEVTETILITYLKL